MNGKSKTLIRLRNALLLFGVALAGIVVIGLLLLFPQTTPEAAPPSPTSDPNLMIVSPTTQVDSTETQEPENSLPSPDVFPEVTLTATQTLSPTPFPLLSNEFGETIPVTWGDYPGPSTWPRIEIPPPIGIIPIPEDQVNILLLGNDFRRRLGTRTDSIMLLTLNPSTGTASVTSFPRDLYIYAPGWTMLKINTIQPRGGYDLLFTTFEYNFGVKPQYYVNINRDTFVKVINSLGGIDVDVPYPLSDPTFAGGKFFVPAGRVHMDGATARWYASSRNTSNVYKRDSRQQDVLKAIFLKLLSLNGLQRAPELYNTYLQHVRTNLSQEVILPLVPLASQLRDTSRISQHAVNQDHVTASRAPVTNAYILLPDQLKILGIILEAVQP